MKVTIAVDDISLPLPPMVTPDTRQTALEVVLELLSDHGVDDIHIIIDATYGGERDPRRLLSRSLLLPRR